MEVRIQRPIGIVLQLLGICVRMSNAWRSGSGEKETYEELSSARERYTKPSANRP